MAITFDDSIEQVDAFNYKHRGGTVNTSSATLGVCITQLDPGAEIHIRFKVKQQNGETYFINEENPVTHKTTPLLKIINEFTDPCSFTYPISFDKSDQDIIYEVEIKFGNAAVELNSQLDSPA